jgi:hypothetical protein
VKNISDSLDEILAMVNKLDKKLDGIIENTTMIEVAKGLKGLKGENGNRHNKCIK